MNIKDTTAILVQPMFSGIELFAGGKKEEKVGHLVLFGLGGIFIEVFKDVKAALTPVSKEEILSLTKKLKGYKVIKGIRGHEGVNEELFIEIVWRLSALLQAAPEIVEMDLNPLTAHGGEIFAVDARIKIEF
jgi:acetyltransferase